MWGVGRGQAEQGLALQLVCGVLGALAVESASVTGLSMLWTSGPTQAHRHRRLQAVLLLEYCLFLVSNVSLCSLTLELQISCAEFLRIFASFLDPC